MVKVLNSEKCFLSKRLISIIIKNKFVVGLLGINNKNFLGVFVN